MKSVLTKDRVFSPLTFSQLHFANPAAYNEIYSTSARWDKDRILYEGFGEDHSSFGMLTYAESKLRKDVLLPLFSRRAILNMQGLIRQKVRQLMRAIWDSILTLLDRPLYWHSRKE